MKIVFKGKYIENGDDFYIEEYPGMTIGKIYDLDMSASTIPENILETAFRTSDKIIEWSVNISIVNDYGNHIYISTNLFWTIDKWRELQIDNVLKK
jgi:hypothetical protein